MLASKLRTWAAIATRLATAKLNGVDPYAWLALTLEWVAGGWPNRSLDGAPALEPRGKLTVTRALIFETRLPPPRRESPFHHHESLFRQTAFQGVMGRRHTYLCKRRSQRILLIGTRP